jgi:FkbM family methyltransferase
MLPAFSAAVQGDVLAFEPVLENYVLARLCVDRNELHNVTLFNCALGDSISNLRMDTKQSATLHAGGGSRISDRGQITPSMTIDALGRRDIILIHLDVEGYEAMALAGARKTLRHCRPLLAIEDDDNVHTDHIRKMGYEPSGRIPGLNLFAPAENMAFRSALSEILNTILR